MFSKDLRVKGTNHFKGAVIVIPTRNRPDLAQNAIQSVLNQAERNVRVIVSDNSTSPDDVNLLSDYCGALRQDRLQYIRPPRPLPMSQHWDWALQEALKLECDHFAFLTDRMVFRPNALIQALDLVERHPDKILSYLHDRVADFRRPFTLDLNEWSGRLYEVASTRLLALSALSVMYDGSCPRMLNCVVPRHILSAIRHRFGTVFSSIAPDWNFTYRALEVVDSVLYYNAPVLVHYALRRSNGESATRGINNDAYMDFVRDATAPINAEAPFPEIITVWNAIISEYCHVKKEAHSLKFPELDMGRYVEALARGIEFIEDPEVARQMEQHLRARGWAPEPRVRPRQPSLARKLVSPRRVFNKLRTLLPPVTFDDAHQALAYAIRHPRRKSQVVAWEEALHQGIELPVERCR